MGSLRSQRRRRSFAVIACVMWLLGIEVLPNLHLAFHDDDHTHGETGAIIVARVAVADHAHDHATRDAHVHAVAHHSELAYEDGETAVVVEEPAPAPKRHRDQLAIETFDPGHAAGGIAHRLLALHSPAPPLLAPIEVPRSAWWLVDIAIERTHVAPHARPTARGPPITRA